MNEIIKSNKYDALIRSIKRKRIAVIVITLIVFFITITVCSPIQIEVLGEMIVDYTGINPIITVFLVLIIFFFELIAYALVSAPLNASLVVECNPEKHLILNYVLNKQRNKEYIYAADLMYMGKYEFALDYANKMINSKRPLIVLAGLFNKARCEFFINDVDSLKNTVKQYETMLNNMGKLNEKSKSQYIKIQKIMNLLVALLDKDNQRILEYRNIEVWNNSKATQGYVSYLKGVAAYNLGDLNEAIYRLMDVKENYEKTVFAQLAEQYLSNLNSAK